jgi:hypothetical protein
MWESLAHFQWLASEQWSRLSGAEKFGALILSFLVLFYLAKNADSYAVNTIAALVGFALVAYLVIFVLGHT